MADPKTQKSIWQVRLYVWCIGLGCVALTFIGRWSGIQPWILIGAFLTVLCVLGIREIRRRHDESDAM